MTKSDSLHGISTRQKLINAAYEVFAEKGYDAASIRDIAARAGITSGLVHYHFKNKQDLLLAVHGDIQSHYHRAYATTPPSTSAALQEIQARVTHNPNWYRWRYELYALGLKDKKVQGAAAAALDSGRKSIAGHIQSSSQDDSRSDNLASILLACFDGLALQKLIDKNFNIEGAYDVLEEMVETYRQHTTTHK